MTARVATTFDVSVPIRDETPRAFWLAAFSL